MKNISRFLVFAILALYLVLYFVSSVDGQSRTNQTRKKKPPKNKFKPTLTIKKKMKGTDEEEKKQIQCLVCQAEFVMMDFNEAHRCYNPGLNATATKQYLISTCPIETKFCITEIVRIHGVFAAINRKCGGVFCVEWCTVRSFGIERETCTFCCDGIQPHHYQVVDEPDLISYLVPPDELNSNSITHNRSLTSKEIKEIKMKIQEESMKSAYNCPQFHPTEF